MLTTVFFFACQQDDEVSSVNAKGYLRLQVGQNAELTTKADEYNSERIAVYIKDSENKIVDQTTDFDADWKGKEIELPVGEYTIEAESYGWDGEAGEDKAYYKGSTTVTIEKDKPASAEVICYLANVKVTVAFEQDFLTALGDGTITVQVQNVNGQTTYKAMDFSKSSEKQVAYFAATDINVKYTVTTDKGSNTETKEIRDVKARDHYILNFRLEQEGTENVTVKVDPTMTLYEYTFNVSTTPKNSAVLSAGAWDRLAYLTAENISVGTGVSAEGYKFQYRVATSDEEAAWTDLAATASTTTEGKYTAMLTGLTASTKYQYRLVNGENVEIQKSADGFTTEAADTRTALQNASFEQWSTVKAGLAGTVDTAFPNAAGDSYWDTSNKGANSISRNDPTSSVTEPVVDGTYAAKLESKSIYGVLAAASLYTGTFGAVDFSSLGATLTFGQSFSSRPIALQGYYKYIPKNVDTVGDNLPEDATVSSGQPDQCSIYIALAKKSYEINNKDEDTFINFEEDENIIAYGALPSGAATSGEGYTQFTIPLQYKESQFGATPTHIIVVCSASKYGDYMTGGVGSTLYVDNFSLVYDGEPTIWDLSANN